MLVRYVPAIVTVPPSPETGWQSVQRIQFVEFHIALK